MSVKLHSEQISKRLFISVLIIVMSLLCISIPLIVSQYQHYNKARQALIEIESLKAVADLANRISRERGPANMAMSSTPQQLKKNLADLQTYRDGVDQQITETFEILKQSGFDSLTGKMQSDLKNRWCFKKYADYILTTIKIS